VKRRDEKLFSALVRATERRMHEFIEHNVSNTAWAFATVNYQDEKLLVVLAIVAERRLSMFNRQFLISCHQSRFMFFNLMSPVTLYVFF